MLVFTIITILLVICIIGFIKGINNDSDFVYPITILGLMLSIVLIALIIDLPWKNKIKYDIAKYEELKIAIEQVNNNISSENNNKIIAQSELFDDIYEMNKYIEKHKVYKDSWWVGWLYSEKIANLQLLNYVEKE